MSLKHRIVISSALGFLAVCAGFVLGQVWQVPRITRFFQPSSQLIKDFSGSSAKTPKALPLLAYSIPTLQTRIYQPSEIKIVKKISEAETFTSYEFVYTTLGKNMSGHINVPKPTADATVSNAYPVIVMIRGYIPPETYQIGAGTKNAAAVFAEKGYVTIAPDFFGFGDSDPEPEDPWQARFEKPIAVIELIKSIREYSTISTLEQATEKVPRKVTLDRDRLGIWAHSNGGQIALTTLEILKIPIPTTLWAPVTVPFPYSILYFSDEDADEGKGARNWIAEFEKDYDVFDFSLTKHLESLSGNQLQIQHGETDDAALKVWSDEFITKIKKENQRRQELKKVTQPDQNDPTIINQLEPIEITYFTYPNTDHNMRPNWEIAIDRDLSFFGKWLAKDL